MKRIYLLMIAMVALVGTTSAQVSRNVDLALEHLIQVNQATPRLMMDGDTLYINDGQSHPHVVKYRFLARIICKGPDTLTKTDTIRVRGRFFNFRGYMTSGNGGAGGLGINDTTYFDTPDGAAEVIQVNPNLQASVVQTTDLCDTLLEAYDMNNNNIPDPDNSNNSKCTEVVDVAWKTSVDDYEVMPKEIFIYPNPATNRLDIKYNFTQPASEVAIVVTNSAGQVVISENHSGSYSATERFPLNISSLAAGMYFIRMSADNGDVLSSKFHISR